MLRVDDLLNELQGDQLGGLYELKVLPFGLVYALAIFQALINEIFACQIGKSVLVHLYNILVYNNTLEEHIKHLKEVFEILKI